MSSRKKRKSSRRDRKEQAPPRGLIAKNSWVGVLCALKGILVHLQAYYVQVQIEMLRTESEKKGKKRGASGKGLPPHPGQDELSVEDGEKEIFLNGVIALLAPLGEEAALMALFNLTPKKRARGLELPLGWYKKDARGDWHYLELVEDIAVGLGALISATLKIEGEEQERAQVAFLKAELACLQSIRGKIAEAKR